MILIIDNYDSFVFNVISYVKEISNEEIIVKRNDKISLKKIKKLNPRCIILSPGPKHPKDSGICLDILNSLKVPILGICLGHQAMGLVNGGKIKKLKTPKHGKISKIKVLNDSKIFKSLPHEFEVMRYHSLHVSDLPKDFIATAKSEDGVIMAMEHKKKPLFGIQFHPESYFTEYGLVIIENFLGFR